MNYIELLKSEDWKKKRKSILERDNYSCQRCGTGKKCELGTERFTVPTNYLKVFKKIEFISNHGLNTNVVSFTLPNDKRILAKTNFSKNEFDRSSSYVFAINLVSKDKIQYPFNGSVLEDTKLNLFHNQNEIFFSNYILNKISHPNVELDKEGIWFVLENNLDKYVKDNTVLHVHHKCYRQNIEIWNQKDDEYVALCNICHAIIHDNQLIPFFDKNGNVIQYMTPCPKCGGRRRLECYKHVDDGICYECKGTGKIIALTNIESFKKP